ncbi:SPP1 gp7 family putative phage head morphogenesis protein [Anoxybacillus vitaminiphilus]|uniref:SPP1 gp7 family putative phage head morphogenesis protein n=1 Tax=Paranoxybacillus vitaminiphilus TaxID=581036 RepID=A0A327YKV0_9BACL|nr:minor capsid protein [Anoxybacillus vitaminiphilus]RAK21131.1 SPP1 gp7 family putative phage head morphogenesis protein [Anoxybacillus vitaminiphilus]
MSSREYWAQRAAQREQEAQLIADKYLAQMQQRLKEAQRDILQQIEAFYARYARDNKISLYEAKKILTSQEIEEFKKVDLVRFRAMALEGNPQYENLLNAISYRVRISRLELLHAQIEMIMLDLYGGKNGLQHYTYTGLVDVYHNSYYHFMYDFAMAGIPANVQILDDSTMREVMSYNWSGKEFSERIWGHEQETMQQIRKSLEQSFIIGRSIDRTAKEIVRVTDVAYSRAEALVRTEASFFHNLAAHNSYRDAGMEKYEILATLDMRTSDICRYQDGKVYNVKDYKPGTNAPPFHVRCRTTTIPYFDESEYTHGEKRQSMNGLVDSVSYDEWYNRHIKGNTLEIRNPGQYSKQYLQKMNDTFKYFKNEGFSFKEHAVNRVLGQKQSKGKRKFTKEDVLDVLKTGKRYHQAEGDKTVYFKDGIAVIQANDTGEIVSIVARSKPKEDWREIDG